MVFGFFRKNNNESEISQYADVVVISLKKPAYYADSRDDLIRIVGNAIQKSPTGNVVIEMSQVKQFTSGPLGALVVSARKASEKGGRLVLAAAVSSFVGKVLATATKSTANPTYPDLRGALVALSSEAAAAFDRK